MSVKERPRGGNTTGDRVIQKKQVKGSHKSRLMQDVKSNEEIESSDEEDNVLARTSLDLSSHPMPPLEALGKTIAQFSKLQKLDISSMKSSPANANGLTSLQWLGRASRKGKERAIDEQTFGDSLTWLKMTDNPSLGEQAGPEAWIGIENLMSLAVLNASSCALVAAPPASALLKLSNLAALVLAHNSITTFSSIPHLPHLNTLVLSHNKISRLPKDLAANLSSLKKLSITQNALEWKDDESPLPDFTQCSHLREVRISGNSRLGKLPDHLSTWGRGEGRDRKGTGLETLEMADCGLNDWASIDPLMKMTASEDPTRKRRGLGNLSLKGNLVVQLSKYRQSIFEAHPTLRTLDGEKVEKGIFSDADHGAKSEAITPVELSKRDKKGKMPLKDTRNLKMNTEDSEIDVVSSKEPKAELKARVRGKRGGRSAKGEGIRGVESFGRVGSSQAAPEEPKSSSKDKVGATNSNTPADERMARRAGPPPTAPLIKKKDKNNKLRAEKDSTIESVKGQSKKRKAWDEGSDEKKIYGKKRAMQSSPPPQKEREKVKAQTSVAAVIQLNKKQKRADKIEKPIWGRIGGTVESLGSGGSAWE